MQPRVHREEIKELKFEQSKLVLNQYDIVSYHVSQDDLDRIQSIQPETPFFFALSIQASHLKSERLYFQKTFSIQFLTPGNFTIRSINFPGMLQKVTVQSFVEEKETESDSFDFRSVDYFGEQISLENENNRLSSFKPHWEISTQRSKQEKPLGRPQKNRSNFRYLSPTLSLQRTRTRKRSPLQLPQECPQQKEPHIQIKQVPKKEEDQKINPLDKYNSSDPGILLRFPLSQMREAEVKSIFHALLSHQNVSKNGLKGFSSFPKIFESLIVPALDDLPFPRGFGTRKLKRAHQKLEYRF